MEKIKYAGRCLLAEMDEERVLVVGDLHLGYEEFLNREGVFVSRGMYKEMMGKFYEIFDKAGKVDEVVLLGDAEHSFGKIMKQEWSDASGLFSYLKEKCSQIIIIKGNHDKIIEPIAEKWNIKIKDFYLKNRIVFLHGDRDFREIYDKKIKYWITGHGHPAVRLSDGVKVEKYKCFLTGGFKGKKVIIVPSFFAGNEGSDPRENNLGLAWNFDLKNFKV